MKFWEEIITYFLFTTCCVFDKTWTARKMQCPIVFPLISVNSVVWEYAESLPSNIRKTHKGKLISYATSLAYFPSLTCSSIYGFPFYDPKPTIWVLNYHHLRFLLIYSPNILLSKNLKWEFHYSLNLHQVIACTNKNEPHPSVAGIKKLKIKSCDWS